MRRPTRNIARRAIADLERLSAMIERCGA